MNSWISKFHGMELDPIADDSKRFNENGILFLVTYYYLKDLNKTLTNEDLFIFNEIVRNLRTHNPVGGRYQGLFDRGQDESLTKAPIERRTISHDNLSAIASFSKTFNLPYYKYIYIHGKDNFWRFDNAYPENPRWSRISHLRDIIYWSALNRSKLAYFFMWFFYFLMILTCLKKTHIRPSLFHRVRTFLFPKKYPDSGYRVKDYASSGKQLAFVRLYPLRQKSIAARVVWKICEKLIRLHNKDGMAYVFEHYYKNPHHPIRELASKLQTF